MSAPDFACAECGTTTATTYVVTTLDPEDVEGTRTEVCRDCDDELREVAEAGVPCGSHVKIGAAGKTVWLVSSADADGADLYRVSETGSFRHRYVLFATTPVTIVGRHISRTDEREQPQNCSECGLYRPYPYETRDQ